MKNKFIQLKNSFDATADAMTLQDHHVYTNYLIKKIIYLFCLFNTFILLPKAEYFWGENSFIRTKNIENATILIKFINALSLKSFTPYYEFFIFFQILFILLAVFDIFPRFSALMIYFFTINLNNRMHIVLDGGHNLLHLLLFYLMFLNTNKPTNSSNQYTNSSCVLFKNCLSNFVFIICQIQIAIIYFVAGFSKVTGSFWQKGVALYYTLQIPEYTTPFIKHLSSHFHLMTVIATYGTVIFQISFPFLIWNKKLRPLFLFIGSIMHLSISFGMGLLTFGLTMFIAYGFFYSETKSQRIFEIVHSLKNKIREFSNSTINQCCGRNL